MAALRLLGVQWKVSVCSKRTYPKGTLSCRRFLLRILDWATPWHTRMSHEHDNSSYIIIKNLYYIKIGYIWRYLVYSSSSCRSVMLCPPFLKKVWGECATHPSSTPYTARSWSWSFAESRIWISPSCARTPITTATRPPGWSRMPHGL